MRRLHWSLTLVILLVLLGQAGLPAKAISEDELKAAMILQLAKFVEWPPVAYETSEPFIICAQAKHPLYPVLRKIAEGETVIGRSLLIQFAETRPENSGCRILLVSATDRKQMAETLATWNSQAVLTICDGDGFAQIGGMVNLTFRAGRIAFEINAPAAEKVQLRFSSKLLRLARLVTTESGAELRR